MSNVNICDIGVGEGGVKFTLTFFTLRNLSEKTCRHITRLREVYNNVTIYSINKCQTHM